MDLAVFRGALGAFQNVPLQVFSPALTGALLLKVGFNDHF
jgi:hypothetical protein